MPRFEFIPQPVPELSLLEELSQKQKLPNTGKVATGQSVNAQIVPCTLKLELAFSYYFNIAKTTSNNYKQAAFNTLLDEITMVALSSVKDIFVRFNYHYCPTFAFLRKNLKGINLQLYKQQYLCVEDENEEIYLKILAHSRRKCRTIELPIDLKQEVEWTNRNASKLVEETYEFPKKIAKNIVAGNGASKSIGSNLEPSVFVYKCLGSSVKDLKLKALKAKKRRKRNPRNVTY